MKTEILTSSLSGASVNIHNTRKTTEDYVWDMHIHKECEMCMMIKGKKIFYINDKKVTIDEGDIIFVNENIPHKTENFKGSECFLMQCKNEYYANATNTNISCYLLRKDEDYAVFRKGDETNLKLKELFEHIYRENDEKNLNYEMFVKSYVMQVFAILYRCEILKDAVSFFDEKSINRILPALEYIENHYNENLNLQDVSKTLNVDKAHFCRLFKKATDTSFVQYLNFVRIQKAEKLLTETELSISEISHRVGFSSPTYFAETFRMIMNCTPRFYKKNKQ